MLRIECNECHEMTVVTQSSIMWPFTCATCTKDAELLTAMAPATSSLNRTASGAELSSPRISRSIVSSPWKYDDEDGSLIALPKTALPSERVASRFAGKTASEVAGLPYLQTVSVDETTAIIDDLNQQLKAAKDSVIFLEAREKSLSRELALALNGRRFFGETLVSALTSLREAGLDVHSARVRLERQKNTILELFKKEKDDAATIADLRTELTEKGISFMNTRDAGVKLIKFWMDAYRDERAKTWWMKLRNL